jgi:hypothetical protein
MQGSLKLLRSKESNMRKMALCLAGGAAALGVAAPAAAQFYPAYAPAPYGYAYPNPAIAGGMEARVASIRAQVRDLQARGLIRWDRAQNLDRQAFNLQRSIRNSTWRGISPGEAYSLNARIANLERRVARETFRRGYGYRRYAGYRY